MSDYTDYENNLAFDPTAGTVKSYTDRTELTIKLIDQVEKLTKRLEIAKDFIRFVVNYDCKVVVPKDFSKYEACWFLIRSFAQEKLEQIEELEK